MAAVNIPPEQAVDLDALRARIDALNAVSNVLQIDSPLDGNEIMQALTLPPGPHLRDAKEFLTERSDRRPPGGRRQRSRARPAARLVAAGRRNPRGTETQRFHRKDEGKRIERNECIGASAKSSSICLSSVTSVSPVWDDFRTYGIDAWRCAADDFVGYLRDDCAAPHGDAQVAFHHAIFS